MAKEFVSDPFVGEIGGNIPKNKEEMEEDLLEFLYQRWLDGKSMKAADVAVDFGISKAELNGLLRRMVRHNYLKEVVPKEDLIMTDFGKAQGMECLHRHENLTTFLQLVSGMELEQAQENACRLEHIIDKQAVQGIMDFVRHGDVYERKVKYLDLRTMYTVGEYGACMILYRVGERSPRILAREQYFQDEGILVVDEERSCFWYKLREEKKRLIVWYRKNDQWVKAEKSECPKQAGHPKQPEYGYILPTTSFTFTTSAAMPFLEGALMVGLTMWDELPTAENCRELFVYLLQK
ncbi:MAG: iron dependent repressor, metal binding and dimerization domain protein [Hespellia sp.]|nr:iron dependent repressor, metal binding and dimerization domain protein [Hespellia sp.]